MRRILRLYPAAWRERYGDEMDAVLDERPMGPFEMVDLALGALDAHLHLRGLGNRSEHRKGITMSLRTAGTAAVIAALLYVIAGLAFLVGDNESGDALVALGFFTILATAAAIVVATAGLSAFQAHSHPRTVWASFAITAAGSLMLIVGWLGTWLVEGLYVVGFAGLLVILGGSILFGLATYITAALSRLGAAILAVGATVNMLFWLLMAALGGITSLAEETVMALTMISYAAGWVLLGIDAIRRGRPLTNRSTSPA